MSCHVIISCHGISCHIMYTQQTGNTGDIPRGGGGGGEKTIFKRKRGCQKTSRAPPTITISCFRFASPPRPTPLTQNTKNQDNREKTRRKIIEDQTKKTEEDQTKKKTNISKKIKDQRRSKKIEGIQHQRADNKSHAF